MRVAVLAHAEMKRAAGDDGNPVQDTSPEGAVSLSAASSEALAAVAFYLGLEQAERSTRKRRAGGRDPETQLLQFRSCGANEPCLGDRQTPRGRTALKRAHLGKLGRNEAGSY